MTKPDLEASLSTLDTLIQIFAVLVAVGIVGEVGFGVRHWILNRRLQAIQHSEDQAREHEIAALNKEAGDARRVAAALEKESLDLRKQLVERGSRKLSLYGEPRRVFVQELRPFAGQKFEIRYCKTYLN